MSGTSLKGAARHPAQRWLIGQLCQSPCRAVRRRVRRGAILPRTHKCDNRGTHCESLVVSQGQRSIWIGACLACSNALEPQIAIDVPNLTDQFEHSDISGGIALSAEDIMERMRLHSMLDIQAGSEVQPRPPPPFRTHIRGLHWVDDLSWKAHPNLWYTPQSIRVANTS